MNKLSTTDIADLKLILAIAATNPAKMSPDTMAKARALNAKIKLPPRTTVDPR